MAFDYIRQFGTGAIRGLVIVDEGPTDFKWDDWPHGFVDLPTLHSLISDVQDDKIAFLQQFVPGCSTTSSRRPTSSGWSRSAQSCRLAR